MGILKGIKEYKLKHVKQAKYIPILDRDPSFAAHAMTKEDTQEAYELLKEVYNDMEIGDVQHTVLSDTVFLSSPNFMWFATFFREIEKIFGITDGYPIPYKLCPDAGNKGRLEFQHPFRFFSNSQGLTLYPLPTNVRSQDAINNYRIKYISEHYVLNDFQDDCFPGWYLLGETTVYESYNDKTNTRVKIDFRNGEFVYYIAGASDNWSIIPDVPLEIDHVTSALLFRSTQSSRNWYRTD